jgi:Tol biopolymer transport system component
MAKRWLAVAVAVVAIVYCAPAVATVSGENGKIVYVIGSGDAAEIYVADSDGSNPVRLTNNASADTDPVWSPDGRMIAFTSKRDGDAAIYTMKLDGTNQQRLTGGEDPAWSPDGTQIVYEGPDEVKQGDHPIYGATTFRDLWVIDVAGGAPRRLTNAANDSSWNVEWVRTVSYRDPTWSPNGGRLAFIRVVSGPTPTSVSGFLLVVDVNDPSRIIAGPFEGFADPDWPPTGDPSWSRPCTRRSSVGGSCASTR